MGKDFIVSIKPGTDRANDFLKVFGSLDVRVESFIPFLAELPGFDEPQKVYLLDLKWLTNLERRRLCLHLAGKFNIPVEEVESEIDDVGVPILDQDCYLILENPQRWV